MMGTRNTMRIELIILLALASGGCRTLDELGGTSHGIGIAIAGRVLMEEGALGVEGQTTVEVVPNIDVGIAGGWSDWTLDDYMHLQIYTPDIPPRLIQHTELDGDFTDTSFGPMLSFNLSDRLRIPGDWQLRLDLDVQWHDYDSDVTAMTLDDKGSILSSEAIDISDPVTTGLGLRLIMPSGLFVGIGKRWEITDPKIKLSDGRSFNPDLARWEVRLGYALTF